ncbi:dihydrolipoamide acetyltransferase family protein [Microbacterium sp. NPDC019599]|uniref:dihydrolipoamide acetyltransferase family protein n=1 Tax=Microbacterium sp. NPDC019599 TaxID=3154690 RepID=UPI0033F937A1
MATVVRMPAVMAGATEAAVQSWLVAVGDAVDAGQSIAEIETEKAVFEQESEASGIVAALLVAPGESVAVGAPIAVLADEGESTDAALTAAGALEPAAVQAVPTSTPAAEGPDPGGSARDTESAAQSAGAADRRFASPLVRRLARERRVDLASIPGTGPGGRIVRRDLDALEQSEEDAGASGGRPVIRVSDAGENLASDAAATGFTDIPHTPMRRAVARRVAESKATIPHFYLRADCRVDALLELRRSINDGRAAPITLNDLVVKAVAAAFVAVPAANAVWTDAAIRRFSQVDLAVAVAIDGGLVAPVVRGVDRLPLGELSATLRDLVDRARSGRLRQRELEGGSFAVTNLGMHGTREFAAIIDPPHAGILAIGAAQPRPVVTDGALGVATVMTVTLSADHRVLDGALAAEWLAAFASLVEHPARILV